MLKVSELMINDWVYIKEYPMIQEAKRITANHFVRSLCEFNPIPLDEYILMTNEFTKVDDDGYIVYRRRYRKNDDYVWFEIHFSEDRIVISFEIDSKNGTDRIHLGSIKFVHEFQHALRLCGLNELADNFKV